MMMDESSDTIPQLELNDLFVTTDLLGIVVKETSIPKRNIEETNSELFFETLRKINLLIL